ncbi:CRM-domain containing factor CFM2, chloroplastic [Jatropha curcas]|uniref:CRM-domain containing factor CFM2, chloroplastic n=1 Tax=Jatropha curcas TaxID=180498 RepID=UPI001894ED60|nr:CRM-domain containing factor CFM2, chloroplastic [Jatropha curcas]
MLLSLPRLYPSPPSKTLHKPSSSLFSISKTLILQNPRNPLKPFIRCSATPDSKTLPHSAIKRIADKLRSLGFTEHNPKLPETLNSELERETKQVGEIFIPLPNQLPKYRVGHTLDPSWSTPENPVPIPGAGKAIARYHELRKEVKKEREAKKREPKVPTLAVLSLPAEELRRLRTIGIAEKRKLKVGKAGITEGIVNGIHERWRRAEVVKIVCEDLCRMNMKRTHDMLERKTGGLVVWRSGSKIVLYRGVNYKYPYFSPNNITANETSSDAVHDNHVDCEDDKMGSCSSRANSLRSSGSSETNKMVRPTLVQGVGSPDRVRFELPGEAQLAEEIDSLLDGLGPRFTDWWGYEPLPVDADLLPAIVPGYRKPFRLLPYGVMPKLTDDEMTALRRLGRPLPCHFALGRNRKLQGLAASIVKLWEKCEIAKIAVKRGVQNTNSEMMAEELKWLTGGTLLSRDREFIVLYRGKDFLPSAVSSVIKERRKYLIHGDKQRRHQSIAGETLKEAEDIKIETISSGSNDEFNSDNEQSSDLLKDKKLRSLEAAIKRTSIRLSMALENKAKAEKLLAELENLEMPQQPAIDKEGITEEERYMLRKIGLKMKPFLLLGRRGVFDGTIENMHLHWKYRELVKIICKERSLEAAYEVARTLEVESGGILVAVERVSKGYAIVVYRGKNYRRPARLRPPTLLSKREALKRSLEAQRRESLKLHVLKLTRNVNDLKLKLAKDEEAHSKHSFDEVKEDMNMMESGTHVRSYPVIPAHCKGDIELSSLQPRCLKGKKMHLTRDDDEADSNSNSNSNDDGKNIRPAQWADQTDPSLLFSVNAMGKSESKSSMESVGLEAHESLFATMNDGAVDSTSFPVNFEVITRIPSMCFILHSSYIYVNAMGKSESKSSMESVGLEAHESLFATMNDGAVDSTSFPVNFETRDDDEADSNSNSNSNDDGKNIRPAQWADQTDPSLLFSVNAMGKSESKSSMESVGLEAHESLFATMNDGAVDSTSFPVNFETKDNHKGDSNSIANDDGDGIQPAEQANQTDPSLLFDVNGIGKSEPQSSVESVSIEACDSLFINDGAVKSTSFPVNFTGYQLEKRRSAPLANAEHCMPGNEMIRSKVESTSEVEESVSISVEKETPPKVIHLSNRDRLMLRKQALKMKNRPVLAVGRSNIVTGVAKTIKAHFQKYPLAIVNVKGRAKGTSVQEVIFQLEQATGGVLVSQEPSKVILYRGWGAFDEPNHKFKYNAQNTGSPSVGGGRSHHAVSPELMAAIRLECGLSETKSDGKIQAEI